MQICEEMGNHRDFSTLFNYALTSRAFAGPALLWLYRNHHQSGYFEGDDNDDELSTSRNTGNKSWEEGVAMYKVYLSKWALLWKSIIRSSLGKTAYPYCLYIRSLDFRNLSTLLEDSQFKDAAQPSFFADDMEPFMKIGASKRTRAGKAGIARLVTDSILDLVGESITRFVNDAVSLNS
jgi:hypothetical protein